MFWFFFRSINRMANQSNQRAIQLILQYAKQLRTKVPGDFDPILSAIGDAKVVMIGEASHGTHEFYDNRAELTKRLIKEKGFTVLACEADWPCAWKVNQWVKGVSTNEKNAEEALGEFLRFPRWMWRNKVVQEFITWLKAHNEMVKDRKQKTGFYGIDLYSLQASRDEVIKYLEKVDGELAKKAKKNYGCFDRYPTEESYGYSSALGLSLGCEKEAITILKQMLAKHASTMAQNKSQDDYDDSFYAMENAKIVKEAEKYYRHMFEGGEITWNIRDTHMVECLQDLLKHIGDGAKAVIWAHNSHLGDGRETESKRSKEVNIGQLVRQRFGLENTFNIGFTTYTGSVTAADSWDMDPEFKRVKPSLKDSHEYLLHEALITSDTKNAKSHLASNGQYYLLFRSNSKQQEDTNSISKELNDLLHEKRLERAIGVIYRPNTERQSHYFDAHLSTQFDCVIHIETTTALEPLETHPQWIQGKTDHVPDTFPMNV
ncbi:unnamed protein product [Didymodactylos carnosus]|uniref:Erythromycin esterase n=2 Tax=Didymodactylos carnosus TaxID=1234261 RepID=A0A813U8S8_9BILA|nr:unnamed protein product [Didymodactylos carnosus]CAF3609860.1 unnamed protein product [Didymodactylos carnosus]